jgi:hypothetical protein
MRRYLTAALSLLVMSGCTPEMAQLLQASFPRTPEVPQGAGKDKTPPAAQRPEAGKPEKRVEDQRVERPAGRQRPAAAHVEC